MSQTRRHTISALVANRPGVLTRISGLFSRRGYNIESLSVCDTEDVNFSRMTIVVNGDNYLLEQIVKQLDKLVDVKKILHAHSKDSIFRELLLIKVDAPAEKRSQIMEIANIYKAKTVDLSISSMILELTGETDKINAFIEVITPYGIKELARTGVTALLRGELCIKDLNDYNDLI